MATHASNTFAYDAQGAREQVRQASDITAVIGSYLELRRAGRNLVARCPWHDDNRPSLQVNPERQSWKCWVCDIGGDVFSFIMQREGVDFREALEMLAERAGITLTRGKSQPGEPGSPNDKKTLYAAMAWAEQQFHRYLKEAMEADNARDYLRGRGITDESIERFHIGYAPDDWTWLVNRAKAASFSPAVLKAVGLTGESEKSGRPYDLFRGRVLFPIRDTQHRPIAFGGRVLPGSQDPAKYKNSPETRLYSKHEQLYGLDVAGGAVQTNRHIIVMEGYTDVIMAHQHGVGNVVAVCGTAIGAEHVRPRSLLRRYADRITLVLDGDDAGQRRTNQVLEMFIAEQVDLRIVKLPGGLDPCDYLQQQGAQEFQQLVDNAPDALEHSLLVATEGIDVTRDVHAANQSLESILDRLAKAPRLSTESDTALRLRQGQMLRRVARTFGESEDVLRERIAELRAASSARTQRETNTPESSPSREPQTRQQLSIDEQELFQVFCLKPQLFEVALESIGPEHLHSDLGAQLFAAYQALLAGEEYPDCGRVVAELETPELKNVLVTLDWQAHDRAADVIHTPDERLESIVHRMLDRQEREALAKLSHGQSDDVDPLELVKRAILQKQQQMQRGK